MAILQATAAVDSTTYNQVAQTLTSALSGLGSITGNNETGFTFTSGTEVLVVTGTGFEYSEVPFLGFLFISGFDTIESIAYSIGGAPQFILSEMSLTAADVISSGDPLAAIFKGDDTLNGSTFDDGLAGGDGNDTIDGGNGVDTAALQGLSTEYTVTHNQNGSTTVTGRGFTDTLMNVEKLQFDDKVIDLTAPPPSNQAPALTGAKAVLAAGSEDASYVVKASDLLAGFTDADGDALSVVNLTADHGTITANGNGTFKFTPAANYNGPVALNYGVSDGTATVAATQTFTLAAVNDAPALTGPKAVLAAGTEDTSYVVSAADLLAGYSDVDGGALSVVNLTANHGAITANGNGTFTLAPAANYNGPVALSYGVSDGTATVAATQSLTLGAVNDAPALTGAKAVLKAGSEDKTYVLKASSLLAGFTDADGNKLSVVNLAADHGAIKANGNGTFSFKPDANYNGPVALSYGVSDGTATVAATQSLTLGAVNDAPVIDNKKVSFTVAENTTAGPMLKASDKDSAELTWSLAGGKDRKLFSIDGDSGAISFKSAPDFEAPKDAGKNNVYNVTVRVSDGDRSDTQAISITVEDALGVTKNGSKTKGDKLFGTTEQDKLSGRGGGDTIKADAGADKITGGKGADKLYAGIDKQTDTFVFAKGDSGTTDKTWDQVFDFRPDTDKKPGQHMAGADLLDLRAFDADPDTDGHQALRFVTKFKTADDDAAPGQLRVVDVGKHVKVEIDHDGNNKADMVIEVMNVAKLTADDFLL